mgnify:CR=1 FL=1
MPETKTCTQCKKPFFIEPEDFDFYKKIDVLAPKLCPLCRARHRLSFRNERSFYRRACDKCKKVVISMYSPEKPYTVWCHDCWFSDDWNPLDYGRAYTPSRPFMEQFKAVWDSVPKVALVYIRSTNSEYTNISADSKNCYMIVESSNNENCTHCYWIQQCRDLVDVSFSHQTELSYESDDCYGCYGISWSRGGHDCRESAFLFDCRGVSNCVGCVNLRNSKYCIFNKPYSKEEYEKELQNFRLDTNSGVEAFREKFEKFLKTQPRKYAEIVQAPNSSGNYIKNAKNCKSCFHCYEAEDCKYNVHVWRNAKDCMDCDTTGRNAEMMYNTVNAGMDVSNQICCRMCWTCSFTEYCYYCFNANNCFGSVGVRKKDYCILNHEYSKEEYQTLREKIVASMKDAGNYGEFFPASVSTFGYNESAAMEQFPLSKEEALELGFKWEDFERGTFGKETISWAEIPDAIGDADQSLVEKIFACIDCKKNYRIIPDEFAFYKKLSVPLPRLCPDCRHARRFQARGPNYLHEGQCACRGTIGSGGYQNSVSHAHGDSPCGNAFETSLPGENLYCESCHNAEVA